MLEVEGRSEFVLGYHEFEVPMKHVGKAIKK